MSAVQFLIPYPIVAKPTNIGAPGATITFYQPGTTTLKAVYTDSSLITMQANPLTADGAGRWDDIYLDGTTTYKIVINDKNGAELFNQDPYTPGVVNSITGPAGDVAKVATRTALAAVTGQAAGATRYLAEAGREGIFVWSTANNAANVTADPGQGIYVPPATAATGASGAWVRKFSGPTDARWWGAVADDATNSAIAIQRAYDWSVANDKELCIFGGTYRAGSNIAFNVEGARVKGEGWMQTIIKPTTATAGITISAPRQHISGVGLNGSVAGIYGFVAKNASECTLEECDARYFDNDGLFIDPTYGGGADGNNNCLRVVRGGYNQNGGCGIRMAQHADNNDIVFDAVQASANTSHGLLGKSSKYYVSPGCIFEANGGYGIQLGEDADPSTNLDSTIDAPWIEANALGGVRGSASSANNTIRLMSQSQGYTRNAAATNTVEITTGGGLYRFGSNDGVTFLQASALATDAYLFAANSAAGNVNLNLSGAGTGYLNWMGRTQIVDDGDTFAEFNIRPAAAKTGVLTFTHPGVADRWGIGIKTGDANLYFGNRDLSAAVVTFTSAGAATFASTVSGSNLNTSGLPTSIAALSVVGNATNGVAAGTAIAAASDGQVMRRSGTAIAFGAVDLASANSVTGDLPFANITQLAGLSVAGRSANTLGDIAAITGTDGQVLRVSGTALGFGTIATAGHADDSVTYAKMQNVSATNRFLGRITAGAGDPEELTGTQATTLLDAATSSLQGAMSAQDKARMDAAFTVYRSLLDCTGSITAAQAAATYGMGQGDPLAASGTGTLYPLNSIFIAAADYPAVGTLNPKLRIRVNVYCNDVAPGVTFTVGLHPITRPATSGGAGVCIYTIGSAVASSTIAVTTPAADSSNAAVTAADFSLPADGHYVIGVVTSGGAIAASAHVHISAILQMRYA